ncbi:MAG: 30S ribosome-binding factor RbfA [Clostridia bacterium]
MAKRIDRINEEVLKALSELLRTVKDPRMQNGLVSITHCEVTNDLSFATVYISVLGSESDGKEVMKALNSANGYLRRELGRKIKLRHTPELILKLDDSITYGAHISKLINDLDIKPYEEGEQEDDEN